MEQPKVGPEGEPSGSERVKAHREHGGVDVKGRSLRWIPFVALWLRVRVCFHSAGFYCGLDFGEAFGVFLFALAGIGNNRLEVEMEFLGDFFSGLADLLDWIEVLDFVHIPMSSSGVQTTGQVYPAALMAFSTIGRSWALFKWVQFHVRRKSIE